MRSSNTNPWDTRRAMLYGAGIGFIAAAFKLFAPWAQTHAPMAIAEELIGASLAFALLCGLAAALRNLIVRRLIAPENHSSQNH